MKLFITSAALLLALAHPVAAETIVGGGPGCKDKAVGEVLAALTDTDPKYIDTWAKGMQDQSCRGFAAGLTVTVDQRADGLACVRTDEDTECFWVRENMVQ